MLRTLLLSSSLILLVGFSQSVATASTIWSGPTITFTKTDGADPTQAANQDRMTPDDWLTRASSQGLYNAKTESSFAHFFSPADTQWADGTLASYNSLSYTDWDTWAKNLHGGPPNTVGVAAVVHLLTDDIYLSIDFTSWSGSSGGGFSYERSTPTPVPEPSSLLFLGAAGLALVRGKLLRSRSVI